MAASNSDIGFWFDRLKAEGATHMVVVCDTFDYEDYPVPVKPGQSARDVAKQYDGENMQQVMEVYNLSMDRNTQVNTRARVFNY